MEFTSDDIKNIYFYIWVGNLGVPPVHTLQYIDFSNKLDYNSVNYILQTNNQVKHMHQSQKYNCKKY